MALRLEVRQSQSLTLTPQQWDVLKEAVKKPVEWRPER